MLEKLHCSLNDDLASKFVCLFGVFFRPTREIFTRMETSRLPMKCCKFWLMLSTHDHWAARVLLRAIPTVTRGHPSWRTRDAHTYCRVFSSRAVTCITCFNDRSSRLGFEYPTFRVQGKFSNPLYHRRDCMLAIWRRKTFSVSVYNTCSKKYIAQKLRSVFRIRTTLNQKRL